MGKHIISKYYNNLTSTLQAQSLLRHIHGLYAASRDEIGWMLLTTPPHKTQTAMLPHCHDTSWKDRALMNSTPEHAMHHLLIIFNYLLKRET